VHVTRPHHHDCKQVELFSCAVQVLVLHLQCPCSRGPSSLHRIGPCRRDQSNRRHRGRRAGGPGHRTWSEAGWHRIARRQGRCARPSPSHLQAVTAQRVRPVLSEHSFVPAGIALGCIDAAVCSAPVPKCLRRGEVTGDVPCSDPPPISRQHRSERGKTWKRPMKRPLVSIASPASIVMSSVANILHGLSLFWVET
jgi:hypothetical protein